MRDFLRSCPTVSVGCAPFASHALMAGAFRLDCFAMGSYQPSSCAFERWGRNGKFHVTARRVIRLRTSSFSLGGRWIRGEAHLQGGTVATLAGVDGDNAIERLALAAEASEANLWRRRVGEEVSLEVVGFWQMRA